MNATGKHLFIFISVFSIVVELNAVTVNRSLCPTNKIAPHRRQTSWEQSRSRTLGLIYGLFGPGRPHRPQLDPLNDLQEQPQDDDQDDCGEIEDYDETDLSTVTLGGQRRKTDRKDRYLFGNNYIPSYYLGANNPKITDRILSRPQRPQRPTRPPYNFEGIYDPNGYRPPPQLHQYPADHIKPVKEDILEHPQAAYRPGLVGGIVGHIVGFAPVRSTTEVTPQRNPGSPFRFPENYSYTNRRQKKSQQINKSTNIIGSFVDLLFN